MIRFPEVTFIPRDYLHTKHSKFTLYQKPENTDAFLSKINSSFFVLYIPSNLDEEILENAVQASFPHLPVKKTITCTLNLAYPNRSNPKSNISLQKTICKMIPLALIDKILLKIPVFDNVTRNRLWQHEPPYSASAYFWSLVNRLACQIVAEGNYICCTTKFSRNMDTFKITSEGEGTINAGWKPILRSNIDLKNYQRLLYYAPDSACNIVNGDKSEYREISSLVRVFLREYIDTLIRKSAKKQKYARFFEVYGISPKDVKKIGDKLTWDIRFIASLISDDNELRLYSVPERSIPDLVSNWTQLMENTYLSDGYIFKIKLSVPSGESGDWVLKFNLRNIAAKQSLSLQRFWDIAKNKEELSNFGPHRYINMRRSVLKTLYKISLIFPPIKSILSLKKPYFARLKLSEASDFIQSFAGQLEDEGIIIELPEAFKKHGKQRLKPVLKITSATKEMEMYKTKEAGSTRVTERVSFDMNSVLNYEWEVNIGDKKLSDSALDKLITDKSKSLIYYDGEWTLVEKHDVDTIKETIRDNRSGEMNADKALFFGLTGQIAVDPSGRRKGESEQFGPYDVQLEGPIQEIVAVLTGRQELEEIKQPEMLRGTLRPYQLDGYNWLISMTGLGFNVCLADDMGLGKTVQVIAYLQHQFKQQDMKNHAVLIICPTSVIGNWRQEFKKFAPDVEVGLYYGKNRPENIEELHEKIQQTNVLLTSYGILRRDISVLSAINWLSIILDESQNIKNYKAQQTKAAYELNGSSKICLTGTPIENKLLELWSMFHFLNPYLLGRRASFQKKYSTPIERLGDNEAAEKLQKTIQPFLLRRLKTDKNIISDLPEKQEIKMRVHLTSSQREMYRITVEENLKKLNDMAEQKGKTQSKFERSGFILNTLMKLKQICNHPLQTMKSELESLEKRPANELIRESGKLQRLTEMLEEILEANDKILIFTQFTQMGKILIKTITERFNIEPLYLHGGVAQKKRTEMVDKFQNDKENLYPIFILSLKAGGTGLNLTEASIVLHFDRWWNPAVENQATDRAYRIGQEKNVLVYKMISEGTVEEKIDKMIEEKKELAEKIVSSTGERWITDLSDTELEDLFLYQEEDA